MMLMKYFSERLGQYLKSFVIFIHYKFIFRLSMSAVQYNMIWRKLNGSPNTKTRIKSQACCPTNHCFTFIIELKIQ